MNDHLPPRLRKPLRLPGFDYRDEGPYFVTVCTWRRRWILGSVRDKVLHPTPAGVVVEEEWRRLPIRFGGLQLDAFTLMPNHVHGILAFETNAFTNPSLSTVVGAWKSAATLRIDRMPGRPRGAVWQRGFHDHIIRSQGSQDALRAYIRDNPRNWEEDALRGDV